MHPWQRFIAWLFSASKSPAMRFQPSLYSLDVNKIARDLVLKEEARRFGEAGIPHATDTALCGFEARIVQHVEKARQDYLDWATIRMAVLNEDIDGCHVSKVISQALQADKEFERKADSLIADSSPQLDSLSRENTAHQRELEDFQREHGLTRAANIPGASRNFLGWVLLVLLIGLEALFNSFFFAKGMTSGLIGGFIQAAIFAACNVGIACFLGAFAIRYIHHRKFLPKMLGFAACLIAIACMIGISLVIAHYRNALVAEASEPAMAAWASLNMATFNLKDVDSLLLFFVSIGFAVFAIIDGSTWGDKYPGYASVAKKARAAQDDYDEGLDQVRHELADLKEEELASLENNVKTAQATVLRLATLIHDKGVTQSRLQTALSDARHCMDALLQMFRTENILHRKGVPAPEYFNTRHELHSLEMPDFSIDRDRAMLEQQKALLASLLAALDTIRANIQSSFTRHHDSLTPLDVQFGQLRRVA